MNHNRSINTNLPVCEDPDSLGRDLIVVDYGPGEQACPDCYSLVFTHNEREFQKEQLETLNRRSAVDKELLRPFHGIVWGFLIGSSFWIIIGLILWAVFYA
jgi:hypothetical protein